MIAGQPVAPGDIVQIAPECKTNPLFGGCMLVISEVRAWGVQGYVQALGAGSESPGGQAYIRLTWEKIEHTGGRAVWIIERAGGDV